MRAQKYSFLIATISLMLICIAGCARAAESFKFLDSTADWNHVKALAAEGKKLIFVDCTTDWCGWCKKMEKEVFPDPKVSEFMENNFIGVRYDMEVDFGITLAMKYRVDVFPTFLVLGPDGTVIYRTMGYRPADKFLADFSKGIDPANRKQFRGVSSAIDPGFPPFYRDAFLKGKARKHADSAVVNGYLASVSDLSSEPAWSVMHKFMGRLSPNFSDYIFQHGDQLKSSYGDDEVEFVMAQLLGMRLDGAIKLKDEAKAEELVATAEKYLVSEHQNWRSAYMQQFYVGTEQWNKAVVLFENTYGEKEPPSPSAVNEFSWTIYEKCNDPAVVKKAAGWMKDVVTKAPDYASLDTYAALLFKAKEYKEAETWAMKAIDQAKIEKSDSKSTKELIEKIKKALAEK